jgi:hypothetical protein
MLGNRRHKKVDGTYLLIIIGLFVLTGLLLKLFEKV